MCVRVAEKTETEKRKERHRHIDRKTMHGH